MPPALSVRTAIQQFCTSLRTANRCPKTITAYSFDLTQFVSIVGNQPARELSRLAIDAWLLNLQGRGYSAASIRRKMASVRQLFRFLLDRDAIGESPLLGYRLRLGEERRLTRVVGGPDLCRMLNCLDDNIIRDARTDQLQLAPIRDRAIIRLLCTTGLRVGELTALKISQLCLEEETIRVFGKGRRERLAYFLNELDKRYLCEYLQVRQTYAVDDQLFIQLNGKPFTDDGIRRMLRKLATTCGANSRITPHMLRHTAATRLLENGADLRVVQVFLGHASIRSTERYTHVSQAHLKAVLRRCHPLLNVA